VLGLRGSQAITSASNNAVNRELSSAQGTDLFHSVLVASDARNLDLTERLGGGNRKGARFIHSIAAYPGRERRAVKAVRAARP
jgi:hypothetical protein